MNGAGGLIAAVFGLAFACLLVAAVLAGFLRAYQALDDAFNGLGNVNESNHRDEGDAP